jgi:hypothetical protein
MNWPLHSAAARVVGRGTRRSLRRRTAAPTGVAQLIIHEHPQYQGPITLDVLPEEIGELPESDSYVSIEVIQPGDRTGQQALISLERFNKLAPDMPIIVMNAVASLGLDKGF